MALLINKDGNQLGPYSLEEARSMVLAGKLDADDWAWPDGATDWVHLKEVPGFTVAAKPAASPVPVGAPAAAAGPEEELWRGHPSQIMNLFIYAFWGVVLLVTLVVGLMFADTTFWVIVVFGVVALVGIGQSAWAYLHLHAIEYVVSTQRVRIVSGLLAKKIEEIELFRVKDTMAHQTVFERMFSLGTITILSGDKTQPRLTLMGIPRAIELRERLRQEVMTLRQRFGVRELDVM